MLNIQSALLEKTYLYFILRLDLEQQCKTVKEWVMCGEGAVIVDLL